MIKKVPMRSCLISHEKLPKKELIRIVKNNQGEIFIDESGKQNGHGLYLKKDANIISEAIKSKILEKKFGIKVPDNIYEKLKEIINN